MADNSIAATCTKCNVALNVNDASDENSEVTCPQCGAHFGKWKEVKVQMKKLLADKFKETPWVTVR